LGEGLLCTQLKIEMVEPTSEPLIAASEKRGGLSLEDRLCLMLTKERETVCVTNDRRLRPEYGAEGVPPP